MPNRSVKRILMTADTMGGVWTYTLQLARSLQPYGVQVYVATMGNKLSPAQWEEVKKLDHVEVFESTYKLEWMDNPWADVATAGEWLLTLEQKLQPDLIHLNGYVHANLAWQAPVLVVGHSCVLSWWEAVKGEPAPLLWNTYHQLVKRGLQAAGMVVSVSQAMLTQLQNFYGPLPFTRVIYNGQVLDDFTLQEKQPYVFSMGRIWDEAKNLSLLSKAASQLNWKVIIAGDDLHPSTGQALQMLHVHLTGVLPAVEVRKYLSEASIFAMPARYEPFGLSALEAALSGCALVLSDIDTFREIWQDAALFVPTADADVLAWTIEELINDTALRKEYTQKAYARAQAFSSQQMARQYMQLYTDMIYQPITTN